MGLRVYKLNKQKRDFVKISVRLRSHKVLPLSPGTRPQWAWKAKAFSTLKQGSQPGGRDPWDVRRDKTTEAWLRARPTYTERADETTTSQISAGKRHPWETKSRTENTVAAQGRWETCPRQHDEPLLDSTWYTRHLCWWAQMKTAPSEPPARAERNWGGHGGPDYTR